MVEPSCNLNSSVLFKSEYQIAIKLILLIEVKYQIKFQFGRQFGSFEKRFAVVEAWMQSGGNDEKIPRKAQSSIQLEYQFWCEMVEGLLDLDRFWSR